MTLLIHWTILEGLVINAIDYGHSHHCPRVVKK